MCDYQHQIWSGGPDKDKEGCWGLGHSDADHDQNFEPDVLGEDHAET